MSAKPTRSRAGRRRPATASQASRADKYDLYQQSVQEPEADIEFVNRIFSERFGRAPRTLREDFCAAAALACGWVQAHPENRAWGVDIDPEPLEWGRQNNLAALTPQQRQRIQLLRGDVLEVRHQKVDAVMALNFSYFIFDQRQQMLRYLRAAQSNLRREGLLVLDVYGGPESQQLCEEITEYEDFSYVWDQDDFNPINHRANCYIHFDFPDGSRLERAFDYQWRLWSLLELREVLVDAGFSASGVYWEGTDPETEEGDGDYTLQENAPPEEAWVAYLVGVK